MPIGTKRTPTEDYFLSSSTLALIKQCQKMICFLYIFRMFLIHKIFVIVLISTTVMARVPRCSEIKALRWVIKGFIEEDSTRIPKMIRMGEF